MVSEILSPLIIYLIQLEISRQFLGKLENVNWSKPLTEHNRYAAVMLLSDVRRRLHYEIKYVDLPQKIYLDAQREFEQVQAAIDALGKLEFWGGADEIGADDNPTDIEFPAGRTTDLESVGTLVVHFDFPQ